MKNPAYLKIHDSRWRGYDIYREGVMEMKKSRIYLNTHLVVEGKGNGFWPVYLWINRSGDYRITSRPPPPIDWMGRMIPMEDHSIPFRRYMGEGA